MAIKMATGLSSEKLGVNKYNIPSLAAGKKKRTSNDAIQQKEKTEKKERRSQVLRHLWKWFAAAVLFLATGLERDNASLLLCAALMVACAILSMMQRWNLR